MFLKIIVNIPFQQWLTGVGVMMLLIQAGLMGGWSSPTLARLTAMDSIIPLNSEEASWVASLLNFGRFPGAVFGAIASNHLGSRCSILVILLPITIQWLIMIFANSVKWLYVARLLGGLGLGMTFSSFPLYVGEVSMHETRGALVSLASVGAPLGQVLASICSSYFSIGVASSVYLALVLILIGLFYRLPESPHYLVKVGKREAAKKSINWYRAGIEVDTELDAVEKFIDNDRSESFSDKLRNFKRSAIKKAIIQIIILYSFEEMCGINVIMFFMETILMVANFTLIDPSLIVIYVNISAIFASIFSMLLIDKCGRKFLLVISSIGTALSMLGLMTHFLLIYLNAINLQWLPILSIFLFMISYFSGLFPVPNAILGEIFPSDIKCVAACIAILISASMSFLSVKTYQPMVDAMGEAYVFLFYAMISIMGMLYVLFIIPETKGKTLQEIQDELIGK